MGQLLLNSRGVYFSELIHSRVIMYATLISLSLISAASCLPGGYTGLGGMYKNMDQHKDYMPMAHYAATMALSLERDESLVPRHPTLSKHSSTYRSTRNTFYVPTFFSNYNYILKPTKQAKLPEGSGRSSHTIIQKTNNQFGVPVYNQQ